MVSIGIEPEMGFCDVKLTGRRIRRPMRKEECTHTRTEGSCQRPPELAGLLAALANHILFGAWRLTSAA
jgi:hypothetical protein